MTALVVLVLSCFDGLLFTFELIRLRGLLAVQVTQEKDENLGCLLVLAAAPRWSSVGFPAVVFTHSDYL